MKPVVLLAALPLAALLSACHDPSGPGESGVESRMSLAYSGGVTGTFAAAGEYTTGALPNTQTFSAGTRHGDGTVEVTAYSQRGGARFDLASITLPGAAVGQRGVELCPGETCTSVTLALDLGQATGSVATHTCHLDAGTIRITTLSASRVAGSVSGSGSCQPGNGGEGVPFQVTAGTFDVELRQP